ncbi:hypothetical protein D3C73_1224390 [compost metagenome]
MPADLVQRVHLNTRFTGIDPPQRKGFLRIFWLRVAGQYQHVRVLFSTGNERFLPVEIHFAVFSRVAGGGTVVVRSGTRFG